jgi:hypothetical protein
LVAPPPAPDPFEREVARAAVARYRVWLPRMELRKVPRLTFNVGYSNEELRASGVPDLVGVALRIGLRKNFYRLVGMQVTAGANIGAVTSEVTKLVGAPKTYSAVGEAATYFNAGRTYMGPFVTLSRRYFHTETLRTPYLGPADLRRERWQSTVGAQFGVLLLDREELDLNVHIGMGLPGETFNALLDVGYHWALD